MPRVLHVLSQRPSLTGGGVTLSALAQQAAHRGWAQQAICGVPAGERLPELPGLTRPQLSPLEFGGAQLDFPVPGMSDVMPYRSIRFSSMTDAQWRAYRDAWADHLGTVIGDFRPDLIHSHHLWLVSSLLKTIVPDLPVVTQCHATGLRQMDLCPDRARRIREDVARNDRFLALHRGDADRIERVLDVDASRIHVVGAGYREDLFHSRGRKDDTDSRVIYVGKYSKAKGLPQLLDVMERLVPRRRRLQLDVVGAGSGPEAAELEQRMRSMPSVILHGVLTQEQLSERFRAASICVLPSFYEGVPLVLVEAMACGCRAVATDLPGVRDELAPWLDDGLLRVPAPPMQSIDEPRPDGLAEFTDTLTQQIEKALYSSPEQSSSPDLQRFTWRAVFDRVEAVWRQLLA